MSKHTPGPWRWEFNEKHKQLTLVGGVPKYDLTIMGFSRWGMWGAGVDLREVSEGHESLNCMYRLNDRKDWIQPFPGRDHHAHWCAAVNHPDMVLMQSAPELLDALERLVSERTAGLASLSGWESARAAIAKARGE